MRQVLSRWPQSRAAAWQLALVVTICLFSGPLAERTAFIGPDLKIAIFGTSDVLAIFKRALIHNGQHDYYSIWFNVTAISQ
jgi:hypothetical protein